MMIGFNNDIKFSTSLTKEEKDALDSKHPVIISAILNALVDNRGEIENQLRKESAHFFTNAGLQGEIANDELDDLFLNSLENPIRLEDTPLYKYLIQRRNEYYVEMRKPRF